MLVKSRFEELLKMQKSSPSSYSEHTSETSISSSSHPNPFSGGFGSLYSTSDLEHSAASKMPSSVNTAKSSYSSTPRTSEDSHSLVSTNSHDSSGLYGALDMLHLNASSTAPSTSGATSSMSSSSSGGQPNLHFSFDRKVGNQESLSFSDLDLSAPPGFSSVLPSNHLGNGQSSAHFGVSTSTLSHSNTSTVVGTATAAVSNNGTKISPPGYSYTLSSAVPSMAVSANAASVGRNSRTPSPPSSNFSNPADPITQQQLPQQQPQQGTFHNKLQQVHAHLDRLRSEHASLQASCFQCHDKIDTDIDLIISFLNDIRKAGHNEVDKVYSEQTEASEAQIHQLSTALDSVNSPTSDPFANVELVNSILGAQFAQVANKSTKVMDPKGSVEHSSPWLVMKRIKAFAFAAHLGDQASASASSSFAAPPSNGPVAVPPTSVTATQSVIPVVGRVGAMAPNVNAHMNHAAEPYSTQQQQLFLMHPPGVLVQGKGNDPGRLLNPAGIAVYTPANDFEDPLVFVSDSNNHRVQVLSAVTGEYCRSIGFGRGAGPGQLQNPMGLAVFRPKDPDSPTLLYVADFNNHRVLIYNALTGAILQSMGGGKGTRPGQMQHPYGIALHSTEMSIRGPDLLFVAEYDNHRIQVFDAMSGAYLRYFGGRGANPHSLQCPTSVSLFHRPDGQLLLFVTDSANHRIQVYNDTTGRYLGTFGDGRGSNNGQLKNPIGSTIFENSRGEVFIIVTEYDNHRIQIFDAITGAFVATVSLGQGSAVGQLRGPWDVKLGPCTVARLSQPEHRDKQFLYVSEFGNNHRIQTFLVDFLALT